MNSFDEMWIAVMERNGEMDDRFVFGVQSTRVYCRPSCPARRPLKKNVVFFDSPHGAEAAGFRACLRCRPNDKRLSDGHREIVMQACRIIDSSEEPPTLQVLSTQVGMSASHLHRTFKRMMGVTPREYASAKRVANLRRNLRSARSVTDAIYEAGFGSSSRVYEAQDEMLGMPPGVYREGGASRTVHYTVAETVLGHTLVAATEKGICCIEFGSDPQVLIQELKAQLPNAILQQDDRTLCRFVKQISRHLDFPTEALDLPLDIRGTAFQLLVWKALREIPLGETASYQKIASAIGKPTAHRAVARACAGNKLAVAIPCHRVIRSNGEMGGYRWGVERKKRLLEREAEAKSSDG